MEDIARGEIWHADLDPTIGREQRGKRPVLIVSDDGFNRGRSELVIIVPLTSRAKGIPSHVQIDPPEGGVTMQSFAMCEAVRSISKDRLDRCMGRVDPRTMSAVERNLRFLLKT